LLNLFALGSVAYLDFRQLERRRRDWSNDEPVISSEIQTIFGENLLAPQYFPLILVEQD